VLDRSVNLNLKSGFIQIVPETGSTVAELVAVRCC